MSKEFEALECLEEIKSYFPFVDLGKGKEYVCEKEFNTIKQALQRLEAIDSTTSSEALECLKKLNGMEISSMPFKDDYGIEEVDLNDIRKVGSQLNTDFREYIETIKQALNRLEAIENTNPSEALKCLESYINNIIFAKDLTSQKKQLLANIATIKHALQRLESVDNSKPSAALKALKVLDETISPLLEPVLAEYEDDLSDKITSNYFALKQSLLKAREQEKENELLKEIIKSFFDRGCPLHQYTDKEGILQIEVDNECSTMHLGKFKDVDLDEKLKEVLE